MALSLFGDETNHKETEPVLVRDAVFLYFVTQEEDIYKYERGSLRGYCPWFVHQLFPEEQVYGYKDLAVHILYHLKSLNVLLQVFYSLKDSKTEGFIDIETLLYRHLPGIVCTCMQQFKQKLNQVPSIERYLSTWKAISPCQSLYCSDTKVYMENATKTSAVEIYNHFKLLLLFFIETASYIDCEDDKWDLFVLSDSQGEILGFATVYRFTCFDNNENNWSTRVRIAQFLIFPCFHGNGFGIALLDSIYQHYIGVDCLEITVETPCQRFQNMRDVLDTKYCLKLAKQIGYLPSVEEIHKECKITRRQAIRCREIIDFSRLEAEQVNVFRLSVKKRLYSEYAEQMASLDSIAARKEYLWQLYRELEEHYRKIWSKVSE